MKLLISSLAMIAMSTSAFGADIAVDADIDITENTAGKYIATKKIAFDVTAVGDAFGGVEVVAGADDKLAVGDWNVGHAVGSASLSFGKQGNLFVEGEASAANSPLADPSMGTSLQAAWSGVSVGLAFTDIGTDVTDIASLQGAYQLELGGITASTSADYNINTKDIAVGVGFGLEIKDQSVDTVMTYANDVWAYEGSTTLLGITGYLNGDENDMTQNLGGSYLIGLSDAASIESKLNYDMNSEQYSPSLNLSFSF